MCNFIRIIIKKTPTNPTLGMRLDISQPEDNLSLIVNILEKIIWQKYQAVVGHAHTRGVVFCLCTATSSSLL